MANPISRTPLRFNRFDLSVATREYRRFKVPTALAVTISAYRESGTAWSSRTLEVKKVVGPSSYSFASAKTIAAGGGSVSISSSEMEGVTELEVVTATGSAESAGTFATIAIIVESDATQPASGAASDDLPIPPGTGEDGGFGGRVVGP